MKDRVTQDWSNDAENSVITGTKLQFYIQTLISVSLNKHLAFCM